MIDFELVWHFWSWVAPLMTLIFPRAPAPLPHAPRAARERAGQKIGTFADHLAKDTWKKARSHVLNA